jgi:predicted nucleic acid-binding protein
VQRVAVDANVFVSFFIDRNAAQHAAARALMQSAEDGELANKLQTFGLAAYF